MSKIIHGDLKFVLAQDDTEYKVCFADPPDNIGLQYLGYKDKLPEPMYLALLEEWLSRCVERAEIVWWSFNYIWTLEMGKIGLAIRDKYDLEFKACQQFITFGQQNNYDLKNCHRPLYRFKRFSAKLYPESIKETTWRLENGDPRADPDGAVPGDVFDFNKAIGDVFDYPRVVGNSKQKRNWTRTQLHEGLVEKAIKLSATKGDKVLDVFSGTGTTQRVCQHLGLDCTSIEVCGDSCKAIAEENKLEIEEYEL